MAQVQSTDLLIVGRSGSSYQVTFADVKNSVTNGNNITFPDPSDPNKQNGTLDERYVLNSGDVMTGNLQLPTAGPTGNFDATHKSYVDAADSALRADVDANAEALATEASLRVSADEALGERLDSEIERAEAATTALDEKIDALTLDALADATVAGASDGQVVSWDAAAGAWVAKTVVLSSTLDYTGDLDLTAVAPAAQAGELYVNTGSGAVDSSFGVGVIGPLPNAVGGELVAFNGTSWSYVGTVGGGLTYTSFSARNILGQANGGGELSYNADTGMFTFQKADIGSRVPMDLGTLPALP